MKVLVIGASGSGTTTLAKAIGENFGFLHLDADDYYWAKTNPPFKIKVPLVERQESLWKGSQSTHKVVISGSLVSWGKEWENAFDLVIFIRMDPTLRMKRLKERELSRYGNQLKLDPEVKANSKAFLTWAKKYDDPSFSGRSIRIHKEWMNRLNCKIIQLDGGEELDQKLQLVAKYLK